MMAEQKNIWPDRLHIRDTGLHDDMGGGGQRIYTTAGRGYETRVYLRDDSPPAAASLTKEETMYLASVLHARARHQSKKLLNVERNQKTLHPELVKQMNEDIVRSTSLALKLQGIAP